MIIKKFTAKTEAEAIETAKKELGENLVVMNVKSVKKKGFLGLFKSSLSEVTVALEEEREQDRTSQLFGAKKETTGPLVPDSVWEKKEKVVRQETTKDSINVITSSEETGKAIVEKLDGLQNLLQKQLSKSEEEKREDIKEEVKNQFISDETMTFIKLLYNTMIENEVKDSYANELIGEIQSKGKPDMQMDFVLSNVYQKMILKFGQAKLIGPAEKKPKVLYFIGPTGVGKTTTIAKIASKFCVEEKKKIALLTADTYRIAAAEQLRTYANILEVPFRVIYTPEEILQSVEEFRDVDYILVDTAGHAHQNEEQKQAILGFIHSTDDSIDKEVYLVVSATTKYRDLVGIADAYKEVDNYKLIFTKLDETTALGNMYNLRLYTGASLSYVTCGQNVPDDISPFNPQSTVKQILSSN
ncbi:MAG: flagellar biosynthesis protein FlhF [Lachnospiraceae bacterium]|nr:flagellar biosynthesis protein FlhF [Lachnospiraceae bacterium]